MKSFILLSLLIMTCCTMSKAQTRLEADFTNWPGQLQEAAEQPFTTDDVVITVKKISGAALTRFLDRSVIRSGENSKPLKDFVENGTVNVKNNEVEILLGDIHKLDEYLNAPVAAVLVKDNKEVTIVVNTTPPEVIDPITGEIITTGTPVTIDPSTISFIPTPAMEARWAGKVAAKSPVTLNYHTRWAIVYDFSKDDPVSVYKRLNTVIGNTCGDDARGKPRIGCNNIYKIKEVRKLSPTVNRSLLLVIPHYHPYRDSIALSADYGDRFLQDAALFNSTFIGSTGAQTGGEKEAETEEGLGEQADTLEDIKKVSSLVLFTKLRDDLKTYAADKMKQENLEVEVVENGVDYIKNKMTAYLDITDFTAAGILKVAEKKSKGLAADKTDEYFGIVHEAVDLFLKIANYKRYNNHNLLIENKDLISLTLNRYRDGQLVTMNKEAVRSYYTAGGVKVDFSVGLFGSSLRDKVFTTKTEWFRDTSYQREDNGVEDTVIAGIDSVQRKRILKEDVGSFSIGPAIMTHIYWRTGTDVNFSGTLGIAINQEALPRYLLGGSIMFGRDSRWVFSGGAAFGQVKDLGGGYKEGDVVELSELNTLPMKDVWKSSWFLSLTLNVGGFNVGGRR